MSENIVIVCGIPLTVTITQHFDDFMSHELYFAIFRGPVEIQGTTIRFAQALEDTSDLALLKLTAVISQAVNSQRQVVSDQAFASVSCSKYFEGQNFAATVGFKVKQKSNEYIYINPGDQLILSKIVADQFETPIFYYFHIETGLFYGEDVVLEHNTPEVNSLLAV